MLVAQAHGAAHFTVPLDGTNGWLFLKYGNIPANTFRASAAGMEIGVTNSAAPAVYPLTNGWRVAELRTKGRVSGSLRIPRGRQGEKGFDDFTMRVGLVEAGARTLNWREKLISPDWVKQFFALAPPGAGLNKVRFFNVGMDASRLGTTRTHPKSDLMEETILAVPDARGHFAFTNRFPSPVRVLALWISSDGDNSKSSYAVTVERVELLLAEEGQK